MSKRSEEKAAVLAKTNGKCAYCGCDLDLKSMTVDHIDPIVRPLQLRNYQIVTKNIKGTPEQEHINNKLPACRSCNSYKSSGTIEHFRERIEHWPNVFIGNNPCFRAMLRFGVIELTGKPVVFEFERQDSMPASCALRRKHGAKLFPDGSCQGLQRGEYDDEPCDECAQCKYEQSYEGDV